MVDSSEAMAHHLDNNSPEPSLENPSKRFKAQNGENSPPRLPSPSQLGPLLSTLKGKSKLDNETKTESEICGICLCEAIQDGNCASRGYIDSCDHYFCFVCIMEWAKVESKCPLCKRRFSTIRRPSKPPVFPCERLVRVPVRDQVHTNLGNASTGPVDPYSNIECTVCHTSADESLLLLCDLCDSSSHTYCVGLGATVPEGDWFCRDCTLLRAEHSQTKLDTESSEQRNSGIENTSSNNITAFDIVKGLESPIRRVEGSSTSNLSDAMIRMDTEGQGNKVQDSSRVSARTLRQRRNVQYRIKELRDNWNSFRSGSLNFSSSSSSSNQACEVANHSTQSHPPSSLRDSLNSENGPLVTTENMSVNEINKAWRMMDIAKSMEHKQGRNFTLNQASKIATSSKLPSTKDQQLGSVNLASVRQEKKSPHQSLVNNSNKHQAEILEKRRFSVPGYQKCSTGFPISSSSVYCKLTSPQDTRSPLHYNFSNGNGENLPKKTSAVRLTSATLKDCSKPVSLSLSHAKLELAATSSHKIEPPKPKDKAANEKTPVDLKGNIDAKSEIQSLVKLNLKLMDKDKHLGVNAFKEVARSATHSILAACGLEQPKACTRDFPSSVCRHASDGVEIRRSTLMPNSCRECFYVFVKDVVGTIMLEKIQQSAEMHHD